MEVLPLFGKFYPLPLRSAAAADAEMVPPGRLDSLPGGIPEDMLRGNPDASGVDDAFPPMPPLPDSTTHAPRQRVIARQTPRRAEIQSASAHKQASSSDGWRSRR
jgi:hypothetical protein